MRKFKTWRNPYDEGYSTTRPKEIELNEGLTVLVGCNGLGKSTLINNIEEECKANHIPVMSYNNLNSTSDNRSEAAFRGNLSFLATSMCSSEGENIGLNVGRFFSDVREFILTGQTPQDKRSNAWKQAGMLKDEDIVLDSCDDRFLLLDAVDSGYSIDNVVELKELFKLILKDSEEHSVHTYIVVSANEYELAKDENCFDVANGKYMKFADYEEYRKFILKSRELKDKRIERADKKKDRRDLGFHRRKSNA